MISDLTTHVAGLIELGADYAGYEEEAFLSATSWDNLIVNGTKDAVIYLTTVALPGQQPRRRHWALQLSELGPEDPT